MIVRWVAEQLANKREAVARRQTECEPFIFVQPERVADGMRAHNAWDRKRRFSSECSFFCGQTFAFGCPVTGG